MPQPAAASPAQAPRAHVACPRRAYLAALLVALGLLFGVGATAAAAQGRHRPLRMHSHGHRVAALQRALHVPADGAFGPQTRHAVRHFQHRHGLKATGTVHARMARMLHIRLRRRHRRKRHRGTRHAQRQRSVAAPGNLGEQTLQLGARGTGVRQLQQALTTLGFPTGVDGDFGPATEASVRAYEQSRSLPVDGMVDPGEGKMIALQALQAAATPSGDDQTTQPPQVAGDQATLTSDGLAQVPADAPPQVAKFIAAANRIAHTPYRLGGGHAHWKDSAYDCSGLIGYALHAAGLLTHSMTSGEFERYGDPGAGQWMTIYTNAGHAYMVVAGLRFDTGGRRSPDGSRWHSDMRSHKGFVVRHPPGL
jgi:peptidoglycan hydrolase-like protein with peptidoglycan-binding domain